MAQCENGMCIRDMDSEAEPYTSIEEHCLASAGAIHQDQALSGLIVPHSTNLSRLVMHAAGQKNVKREYQSMGNNDRIPRTKISAMSSKASLQTGVNIGHELE